VLSSKPRGWRAVNTTGHVWDESLEEMNNPLPRWWIWLFYLTIVFAAYTWCSIRDWAARAASGGPGLGQYEAERGRQGCRRRGEAGVRQVC
jgi:cytochrome c oxidase cbb3-type subunit 3